MDLIMRRSKGILDFWIITSFCSVVLAKVWDNISDGFSIKNSLPFKRSFLRLVVISIPKNGFISEILLLFVLQVNNMF